MTEIPLPDFKVKQMKTWDNLDDLIKRTGLNDKDEVINEALKLFRHVRGAYRNGGIAYFSYKGIIGEVSEDISGLLGPIIMTYMFEPEMPFKVNKRNDEMLSRLSKVTNIPKPDVLESALMLYNFARRSYDTGGLFFVKIGHEYTDVKYKIKGLTEDMKTTNIIVYQMGRNVKQVDFY